MGFRFYRSFKVLPGVRLNVSKSGISTSLGGRGATFNFGRRGRRYTVGLPGTGLSYVRTGGRSRPGRVTGLAGIALVALIVVLILFRL